VAPAGTEFDLCFPCLLNVERQENIKRRNVAVPFFPTNSFPSKKEQVALSHAEQVPVRMVQLLPGSDTPEFCL